MQKPSDTDCPPSPSHYFQNVAQSMPVRSRDVHSHSTFSELSFCASPIRGCTAEADDSHSTPAGPQQQQKQQEHPASSSLRAAQTSRQQQTGAASHRLHSGLGNAALRSYSRASGMTGADSLAPVSSLIPTPSGAPGTPGTPSPHKKLAGSAALMPAAIASAQRQQAVTAAATTAKAGGAAAAAQLPQLPAAPAAAAAKAVKVEVIPVSEDEEDESNAAAAAEYDDGYDDAALQSNGPGRINLTSKSRNTYGNSTNQQDTRVMIVRRLRAMLPAAGAGAAGQGETLDDVYADINTDGGMSKRGLKWKKEHLDAFYTRVMGAKGAPGSAPWPEADELKPYLELRYLARLFSWLTGRHVTVPQVNACFVDGTADWTAVEANVTALLGVTAEQLVLPLRPLRPVQQQQQVVHALAQQHAASAGSSSCMSEGTAAAPVHATQAAAAALGAMLPGNKASGNRIKIKSAAAAEVAARVRAGGSAPAATPDPSALVKKERR